MRFEVLVELKGEVLDVQGRAIRETLSRLGHAEVADVRASKRFVVDFAPSLDKTAARQQIEKIAREYLAASVAETFVIREL